MSRRIVDAGRLELRGAEARFKQKGTLEAFDRNLGALERVFVRSTPSPDIRLFADFVFPAEVFRVWQDSTLVNYKDFLEKVELAGLENFRALVRHVTRALATHDATTRAFAESAGPPERFVNKDELAEYDKSLARGELDPRRTSAPAPRPLSPEGVKREAVEAAWNELAPILQQTEASTRPRTSPIAGTVLLLLSIVTAVFTARTFLQLLAIQRANPDRSSTAFIGAVAVGAAMALGFFVLGVLYLRRAAAGAKPPAARGGVSSRG